MKTRVSQVREGDGFTGDPVDDVSAPHVFWTALADTEEDGNGGFDLHVRFPDGDTSWRHWDEDIELTVLRERANRSNVCPACSGTGMESTDPEDASTCLDCNGSGVAQARTRPWGEMGEMDGGD